MLFQRGENSSFCLLSLHSVGGPCRHWAVALQSIYTKLNLLTHLYSENVGSRCGTASEPEKHLFLRKTKLEDTCSKSLLSALQPSKNAQSTGWLWSSPCKTHTVSILNSWHQLFCFTCVLPQCCRVCPGSHCFWLVEWCRHQELGEQAVLGFLVLLCKNLGIL